MHFIMRTMIKAYYQCPRIPSAKAIAQIVSVHQGSLDHVEETDDEGISSAVTLTFVFADVAEVGSA